jgi:hypothetical protein
MRRMIKRTTTRRHKEIKDMGPGAITPGLYLAL